MALNNHDQARIREYLLGHLSDEEQEKIEERLMVEDDLFEELEISKGELVQEYCAGELPQNEHHWFERHYLASPEGKRRHTFAVALNCLERPIPSPAPQPATLAERLSSLFRWPRWAMAVSTALVLLTGATSLLYRLTPPVYVSVDLSSNVSNRSLTNTQYRKIALKPDVGEVRISLKLPEPSKPGARYVAELDDRTESKLFTTTPQDANSVLVVIPAKQLPPGFYALSLSAIQADGTKQRQPWEYHFQITN